MKKQGDSLSPLHTSRRSFRRYTLRTLLILAALVGVGNVVVAWLFREPRFPVVQISHPVVSPSGKQIAFIITRGDKRSFDRQHTGRDIDAFERLSKTIDVRLSVVSLSDVRTTNTGAEISNRSPMTWATDESHIAFISGHIDEMATDNYGGLDSINLSTHTVTSILRPEIRMPQYSPDGTCLGYIRGNDLIVENMQTGQRTRLQSGIHHDWCWSPSSSDVFYIKDGWIVCQYDLQASSERTLFVASRDHKAPVKVVSSPDGTQLGYYFDDWFHFVDLQSGNTTKQFKCDHYSLDFDWNATGICYVDAIEGELRNKAKIMIFHPNSGTSSLVASGPLDHPRWLGKSKILVRKGNTELWSYGIVDGKGVKLYGPTDEDE